MRKGVNAWIYPSKFTIDEVLEASANMGFEGVELNINEKALNFSKKRRREIAENASSLGLELPSLCTDLFWKFNLASPEEKVRKKGVEIIEKGCEFASDIGSKVLLVVPAVAVPEITYEETWRLARESILKAALTAEDHEVILGIENVWNQFLYSPLEFRRFIEEINHPYVKMYFDVGNVHFLGFPQQWIRHLSDLIVCIHVKDFLRSERQFKPLLEGDVPWPEVMKALRDIKYKGFLNVELPPYPGHPLKAAIDSKAALDIILKM